MEIEAAFIIACIGFGIITFWTGFCFGVRYSCNMFTDDYSKSKCDTVTSGIIHND